MTPQERDLLARFLDDLSRASPGPKDQEAAQAIDRALSANPDAAYVLVQHAILSDQALMDAQARIADLEGAQPGAASTSQEPSFLGAAFGKASPNPSGAPMTGTAVPASGPPPQPGYGQAPYPGQPGAPQPWGQPQPWGAGQPGPFSGGGGIGSFMRSAGTTAAGVAGGAFLFEGLSGLFGGHRGGLGGGGLGFGGGGGFGGGDNVTINEYGGREHDGGGYASDSPDPDPSYDSDNGDSAGDDYS